MKTFFEIFDQKEKIKILFSISITIFGHLDPVSLEMLDPDPDPYPESTNPKPQHCVSESDPRTDPIFDILFMNLKKQGFGSVSGLDPDSIRSVDPDQNTHIVCVACR